MSGTRRSKRDDGRQTRARLLECAGILAAKKGFSLVTSKEICELAGTNLAAVNYHFGSRDGLYRALLFEIHQFIVNEDRLKDILCSEKSPREKISDFVDMVVEQIWSKEDWQMQVWGREVMNLTPSPHVTSVFTQAVSIKGRLVLRLFSDYTGLAMEDTRLYICFIAFMAPFALVSFGKHNTVDYKSLVKFDCGEEADVNDRVLLENLKQFGFSGLDSYRK